MCDKRRPATSNGVVARWLSPTERRWKLNFDGAIHMNDGKWGIGVVIRGEEGEFKAAVASGQQGAIDVIVGEALALRPGLLMAVALGFLDIEVETDSMLLVNAINLDKLLRSYLGLIYKEIHELSQVAKVVSLAFKPRKCNEVANGLAQVGCSLSLETCWLGHASSIISDILLNNIL